MRGSRQRARAALACASAAAVLATTLVGAVASGPAAHARTPIELSEAALKVAAAAAGGAGTAARQAMADSATEGMAELGRVAASVTPPGPTPSKSPTPSPSVKSALSRSWSWDGWRSGAAGREAEDGSFATWRGEPVTVVAVWADANEHVQTEMTPVDAYADYVGDMDVAVGGLVRGETWKQAASGAFVERWTTAVRNLRDKRAGKGTTYIRIAHEMNGDWMPWGMNAASLADYLKGYRLYASIVRQEFPEARLTWSPNGGNHTNASIDQMYPGDDIVDVVGPDIYDGWPDATTPAIFREAAKAWLTPQSPRGVIAWQIWAERRGKPLALPEWGLMKGDRPAFIAGIHEVISAHPGQKGKVSNAGRFVYDVYFNAEEKFKLLNGDNPQSAAVYKSLTWGS